jgi:hypothetical protein
MFFRVLDGARKGDGATHRLHVPLKIHGGLHGLEALLQTVPAAGDLGRVRQI